LKRKLRGDLILALLLPFSPEPFVFSSSASKLKDQNIQDYNFACSSVRSRILVSNIKIGTQTEFEIRVLRRTFRPRRDEVTGDERVKETA
jgi:hypothetical protein